MNKFHAMKFSRVPRQRLPNEEASNVDTFQAYQRFSTLNF
jgi:hypothetical protein